MQNFNPPVKTCPACRTDNPVDSVFCSKCGGRFQASLRGYCTTCHIIRESDQSGICPVCRNRLVDPQPVGRAAVYPPPPVGVSAPAPVPVSMVYQPPVAQGRSSGMVILTGAAVILLFLGILAAGFYFYKAEKLPFQDSFGRNELAVERVKATLAQAVQAEIEPTRTLVPTKTAPPPTPTEDPLAAVPPLPAGAACFASYRGGLSCIGPQGWVSNSWEEWFGPNDIYAMTTCPDKSVLILTGRDLYRYDGRRWQGLSSPSYGSLDEIACGADGQIWTAGYSGVASFDGSAWTEFTAEQILNTGSSSERPKGIALSPDGSAWLALDNSLAHYQDGSWQVFKEGQGWNKEYEFVDIVVDSQSIPWAATRHGLLARQNDAWKPFLLSNSNQINTLVVDDQDQLWAGTEKNLWRFAGGQWKSYNIERGGQSDPHVNAVALDEEGRTWVGTDWGLNVMDSKGKIVTYHMQNSELKDNHIAHMIVLGNGPALPEKLEKALGGLQGKIMLNGQPLAKARVEVCAVGLGIFFTGATPCSGKPGLYKTNTDENGEFRFDELPEGYYSVTIRTPDGKWKVFSSTLTLGSKPVLISSGRTNVLDPLDIKQDP